MENEITKEKLKNSAIKMIKKGMSDEDIEDILGFFKEDIASLRNALQGIFIIC